MRDPNRIYRLLNILAQGWSQNPDLRLGQLFENLKVYSGKTDLFYMEDDEFEQLIINYFNSGVKH